MKWAPYAAAAVIVCASMASGVYLVMHDHPWFGLLAFILAGGVSVKED